MSAMVPLRNWSVPTLGDRRLAIELDPAGSAVRVVAEAHRYVAGAGRSRHSPGRSTGRESAAELISLNQVSFEGGRADRLTLRHHGSGNTRTILEESGCHRARGFTGIESGPDPGVITPLPGPGDIRNRG